MTEKAHSIAAPGETIKAVYLRVGSPREHASDGARSADIPSRAVGISEFFVTELPIGIGLVGECLAYWMSQPYMPWYDIWARIFGR